MQLKVSVLHAFAKERSVMAICTRKFPYEYCGGACILPHALPGLLMLFVFIRSPMEQAPPSFIDNAKKDFGGDFDSRQVDDIKNLWRVCAVFLLMIPYWISYSQVCSMLYLLYFCDINICFLLLVLVLVHV